VYLDILAFKEFLLPVMEDEDPDAMLFNNMV
jgi:hypothetical protein